MNKGAGAVEAYPKSLTAIGTTDAIVLLEHRAISVHSAN